MNVFQKIISQIGASESHQGDTGWLFAILQFGNFTYTTASPFGADQSTNPVTEAVRRLRVVGIGAHSILKIEQMLFKLESQFNTGHQY